MDGDKQVGFGLVGNARAIFQRDKSVVGTGVNNLRAGKLLLNDFSKAQSDVETKIFFHQAGGADGAGVMSAMAGIDHNTADFQPQSASEGGLTISGGLRREDRLDEVAFGGRFRRGRLNQR